MEILTIKQFFNYLFTQTSLTKKKVSDDLVINLNRFVKICIGVTKMTYSEAVLISNYFKDLEIVENLEPLLLLKIQSEQLLSHEVEKALNIKLQKV